MPVSTSQNAQRWGELFTRNQDGSVTASNFYNIMLLHECILGQINQNRRVKVNKITAASQGQSLPESVLQFVQCYIERGGFSFLTSFFTSLDKSGLETSTIKYKTLTMLIEIISQLLSSRWSKILNMNEQMVFDIFNENLLVMSNYITAVDQQQ